MIFIVKKIFELIIIAFIIVLSLAWSTKILLKTHNNKTLLQNIDFKSGTIAYDEFYFDPTVSFEKQITCLDEDMLQVEYPNGYLLDIGWYHDLNGSFMVKIIKDCNWEDPISIKNTRNFSRLELYVQESVDLIMDLINNHKPKEKKVIACNFDRQEFLAFFGEESVIDKESGSFYYSIDLKNGFEFTLYILAIDEFVSTTLRHESLQSSIFDIGFDEIVKIKLDKREDLDYVGLDLYKKAQEPSSDGKTPNPYLSIAIKPSVSITLGV